MSARGTPESTVILHWDDRQAIWAELSWSDWVRFRGFGEERYPCLADAPAGEHYFLVCILGHCGELANVIPHKYVMSAGGRLVHGFDGLADEEREESCRIEQIAVPTIEEAERYDELSDLGFAVNLPPLHTVVPLLRSLPGLAGARPGDPCWHFLSAIGVSSSGTRIN